MAGIGLADAHHDIVLEAEPERRRGRFDASARRIGSDNFPAHAARRRERTSKSSWRREIQQERLHIGIRLLLLRRQRGAAVLRTVRCVLAQREYCDECWRVL